MDKTNLKYIGVFLLLGTILGFGGNEYLDNNQNFNITIEDINSVYVCTLTEEVGTFHRLSSTNKTGYYYNEDGDEKSDRCQVGITYGTWDLLTKYIEEQGNNINVLFEYKQNKGIIHYDCVPGKCTLRR